MATVPPLLLLAALAAGCGSGEATGAGESSPEREAFVEAGCGSCHGDRGEGGYGPSLTDLDRDEIVEVVRGGRGKMKPFDEDDLSDAQLDRIVAYLESAERERS